MLQNHIAELEAGVAKVDENRAGRTGPQDSDGS